MTAGLSLKVLLVDSSKFFRTIEKQFLTKTPVEVLEADSGEEALQAETAIWKIWLMSGNGAVDAKMLLGIHAMGRGDNEEALAAFTAVTEAQPDFAEGWNKRATVNYLLGRYEESVLDIQKTVELAHGYQYVQRLLRPSQRRRVPYPRTARKGEGEGNMTVACPITAGRRTPRERL